MTTQVVTPDPVDYEPLHFRPLQVEVKLQISAVPLNVPSHATLLATSNRFGYTVCGTNDGFAFIPSKSVRSQTTNAAKGIVPKVTGATFVKATGLKNVLHIALDAPETHIIVATSTGEVYLWELQSIVQAGAGDVSVEPMAKLSVGGTIKALRANPEAIPDTIAVLKDDGSVVLVKGDGTSVTLPVNGATAISWSPKGKQVACGLSSGEIIQVTPEGDIKNRVPPPSGTDGPVAGKMII
ncbi:hypothetical protein DFS34DRAFT_124478 [Phlyctochytrium arcticum]|nr:hypothetical protein DFS34DRAFT_124478 [Phlyctochytrium arcticum]